MSLENLTNSAHSIEKWLFFSKHNLSQLVKVKLSFISSESVEPISMKLIHVKSNGSEAYTNGRIISVNLIPVKPI